MTGDRRARRWRSRDIFKTCTGRRQFVHTSIQRLRRRILAPCAFRKPARAWLHTAHDFRRRREQAAGNQQQQRTGDVSVSEPTGQRHGSSALKRETTTRLNRDMGCAGSNPLPGTQDPMANGRESAVSAPMQLSDSDKPCSIVQKMAGSVNVDDMVKKIQGTATLVSPSVCIPRVPTTRVTRFVHIPIRGYTSCT